MCPPSLFELWRTGPQRPPRRVRLDCPEQSRWTVWRGSLTKTMLVFLLLTRRRFEITHGPGANGSVNHWRAVQQRVREFGPLLLGCGAERVGSWPRVGRGGLKQRARRNRRASRGSAQEALPCLAALPQLRTPVSLRRTVGCRRPGCGYPRVGVFAGFDKRLVNEHLLSPQPAR